MKEQVTHRREHSTQMDKEDGTSIIRVDALCGYYEIYPVEEYYTGGNRGPSLFKMETAFTCQDCIDDYALQMLGNLP
jgi:hypothetical protein